MHIMPPEVHLPARAVCFDIVRTEDTYEVCLLLTESVCSEDLKDHQIVPKLNQGLWKRIRGSLATILLTRVR